MLDSVSSIANLATQLSAQKTGQQVELAVLNKVQDLQKQQGEAVLKLMESATVPAPATGIDVYV